MSTPTEAEIAALDEAGPLLRFAAEHVERLDPGLSLAIAEAVDARQNQRWTPEISQKFWGAFTELCHLIKPVTMDCLAAAHRNIGARSWFRFWRSGQNSSIAERSSSRYLILLIILLAVVTPLQFYAWVSTNLSKQLDGMVGNLVVEAAQLSAEKERLPSGEKDPNGQFKYPYTQAVSRLNAAADALAAESDRAISTGYQLDRVMSLRWAGTQASAAIGAASSFGDSNELPPSRAFKKVEYAKTFALSVGVHANLVSAIILSFVLPILFGAIGAIAYVIRAISDQIRSTTFSSSSPIRHLMRMMLGALMGVVIGLFSGLSSQLSLPPLALAFLAGYGVEAVFSMFDGLIERFRQPRPVASQPSPKTRSVGAGEPSAF
jgi:hypothetical protein